MKENGTFLVWVGLDVSKDSFTVAAQSAFSPDRAFRPEEEEFAISTSGAKKLLKWAEGISEGCRFGIAMETTGIYSNRLVEIIHELAPEQHVSICNAHSVSLFTRSFTGYSLDNCPTDAIDHPG